MFQSWLVGINVPKPFVNKTYQEFFEFSHQLGCVPVALYRYQTPRSRGMQSLLGIRYTFTNPAPSTKLGQLDQIMVLVPFSMVLDKAMFRKLELGKLRQKNKEIENGEEDGEKGKGEEE